METELEKVLTCANKAGMIGYIKDNPGQFDTLLKMAVGNKPLYSWRAAWLVWSCMQKNDPRIRKEIKNILKALKEGSDSQKRELLHVLLLTEVPVRHEGPLFDICITIWEDINKAPGVRITAFRIIVKILKKHPELTHEMKYLLQDQYLETLSPGIKHSLNKMLKEFPI